MNKPHPQAEFIKAWAEGYVIQIEDLVGNWVDCNSTEHEFSEEHTYRIKPPAPKWPETTMSGDDLREIYYNHDGSIELGHLAVANAAIAHALETGQVVLPEKKNYVDQFDYDNQFTGPARKK